jgi:hypothetical protein
METIMWIMVKGIVWGKGAIILNKFMKKYLSAFFVLLFFVGANFALADEFRSSSFISSEPVIFSGSYGTSTSFGLIGSISQISIGTSTSGSFGINSGFLYFPTVTSPVVTATAGNAQVALSWTASVGSLGWTVSGYNVGQSTVSGGPYTYSSSLGNVTSSTRTGLTNGTTYYFVIRPEDTFGNTIATSSEVSGVPVAPTPSPTPSPSPSGGGGGGGGIVAQPVFETKIILKGRTSPKANVTILKDGAVIPALLADINGNWQTELTVSGGIYTFSIYAIDTDDRKTLTTSFTTSIPANQSTTISDIILAPTISADKSTVKQGSTITFFGATFPQSDVNLTVNSHTTIVDKTKSDKFGFWNYKLDSNLLEKGDHAAKSQTVTSDSLTSIFSGSLGFKVGDSDVPFGKIQGTASPTAQPTQCNKNGDINNDKKVNIIDFSILLFYWGQSKPANACANVNQTGTVDIFDFSIMLFWWTG